MQPDSVGVPCRIVQVNRWSSYAPGRVVSLSSWRADAMIELDEPSPASFDLATRALALRLGLDLDQTPACKGYDNGCVCSGCRERSGRVSPAFRRWLAVDGLESQPPLWRRVRRVSQPWAVRKAA